MKPIICTECRRVIGYRGKDHDKKEVIIKNSNYNTCKICEKPVCSGCLPETGICRKCDPKLKEETSCKSR